MYIEAQVITNITVKVPYWKHTIRGAQNPILIVKAPTVYRIHCSYSLTELCLWG